jgi:hypothetical protein
MITLAGSGPSEVLITENRKTAKYIFMQKNSDHNGKITLVHEYIKEGDEFKLKRYRIDPNLSKIVTEELITYALRSGCTLRIRGRTVTLEFGDDIETFLPNKVFVRQILGEPNVDKNSSFVYYYYLLNSENKYEYRAEIIFDEQSSVVSGVNLDYFLYRVEIDFKGRIAVAKVKDYLGFVRLSLNVGLSP